MNTIRRVVGRFRYGPVAALVLLALAATVRGDDDTSTVTVTVTGLRNHKGKVLVNLFKDKKGFPSDAERAQARKRVAIEGDSVEVRFDDVPRGTWAVGVLHDENGNRKLDKSFWGAPLEGYAASNNPEVRRGPPRFDKARFKVGDNPVKVTIRMVYLK
ncbi:MAG: DUF2141 domain-containing protein [Planctomycetota bacterium]